MQNLTLANIQKTAQAGDFSSAENMLKVFLAELFPLNISSVEIRRDALSLNSVNGFVNLSEGSKLFFKFHHEEKEEALTEYYNSQLLSDNGFPVELPLYVSKEVGKQVLLYPVKTSERMADVCKRLENGGAEFDALVKAQEKLDEISLERYIATLHDAESDQLKDEPILQLFTHRMEKGGRKEKFYDGQNCELPGVSINFDALSGLKWKINGIEYSQTLEKAFAKAKEVLAPKSNYAAVIAHGDAHNGNVWYNVDKTPPYLTQFDPAFAGRHIPALLAEVKATFHNIFAHPLWLYDAAEADKSLAVNCKINGDVIEINHSWQLSKLRATFLNAKAKLWKPLLAELKKQGKLPENWEEYIRLALFCCPTLVMNLRANAGNSRNSHTKQTSALGFAISIMLSSAPTAGKDVATEFFDGIRP